MKKIEAIVRPSVFDKVKKALTEIGVHGMNYMEIRGFGRQGGHTEVYRASVKKVDFLPKVRMSRRWTFCPRCASRLCARTPR